jgi:hypothetical protein
MSGPVVPTPKYLTRSLRTQPYVFWLSAVNRDARDHPSVGPVFRSPGGHHRDTDAEHRVAASVPLQERRSSPRFRVKPPAGLTAAARAASQPVAGHTGHYGSQLDAADHPTPH